MPARTTSAFWGTRGQFPETISNALAEPTTKTWDYGLGVQIGETDPNGVAVSWIYDVFGRRIRENRPDHTYGAWVYNDCPNYGGCLFGSHGLAISHYTYNGDGSIQTDGTTYFDPLGRPVINNDMLLASGTYSRNEERYDIFGNVSQQAVPCTWSAVTAQCSYWTTFSYDALNRRTQSSRPKSESEPTTSELTSAFYEGLGTRIVDALGRHSSQVSNVAGSIARTVDDSGYFVGFDYDAFGDLVRTVDSSGSTLQSLSYNILGMKVGQNDADMGAWGFTPDALGEVVSQTDANLKTIAYAYDALGRLGSRTEAEGTSTWTYGSSAANHNIDRLVATAADSGYSESYTYDGNGRPVSQQIVADTTYQYNFTYNDNTGLLDTLEYPSSTSGYRLKIQYTYQNGILQKVADFQPPSTVFWQANAANIRGQITQETLGNGVITNRSLDSVTGWLNSLQSGVGGGAALQNESYLHDVVGNVTQRQSNNAGLTENFYYDNLYRLEHSDLGGTQNLALTYDATGNIMSRSDIQLGSVWTYGDATKKHGVTQAGAGGPSYTYDANGNALSRKGNLIQWTSYNHPTEIDGANGESVRFAYDQNRERWRAIYTNASGTETTYFIGPALEKVAGVAGAVDYRHYIYAGGTKVAVYSRTLAGLNALRYLREDGQGSVASVLNDAGATYVKESFTAFGNRRSTCTWSGAPTSGNVDLISHVSRQGYTWQTMLGAMGLNDMHGRIQDAVTGRFLSADPYISDPTLTQGYNRYSYVYNNPVTLTDPSGYRVIHGGDSDQQLLDDGRDMAESSARFGIYQGLNPDSIGGLPAIWSFSGIGWFQYNHMGGFYGPDGAITPQLAGSGTPSQVTTFNFTPGGLEFEDGRSSTHIGIDTYYGDTYLGRYNPDTAEFASAWDGWNIPAQLQKAMDAQYGSAGAAIARAWNGGLRQFATNVSIGAGGDIVGAAAAGVIGAVAVRGAAGVLDDAALVCRGGACTAERFANGSGVSVDSAGRLQGVSVNSANGKSLQELTVGIPNRQVGVTTVGDIRALGGDVIASPGRNIFHCTLCGITPAQAEELFTPTVLNPIR
jgi:RHS repeat-associated protein